LTHRLDALRRATTVALNARLIPLICDLIAAVERTMAQAGIRAPLMVVKGDGSLMSSTMAMERPIETILSGPAASVVGAQHLSESSDLIVVDMGGTTTDIAVLSNGRPRLSPRGAQVGRWRTMVEAVDVHTVGLGGDSRVWLDESRELCIGPRRVVPLCLLASEHPAVADRLEEQAAQATIAATAGEFLLLQRSEWSLDGDHPPFEEELLAALRQGPCSMAQVHAIVRHPELYARYLGQLERRGTVIRSGFTPTDAAHVLGHYADWDTDAATLGAAIMARRSGTDGETLSGRVITLAAERIAAEVVYKLLSDEGGDGHVGMDADLICRALRPRPDAGLACSLSIRSPLVAIGAPVRTYFPAVAGMLHGELAIPEHTGVANAIGAVAGSVVQRIHILVLPHEDEMGYRVHLPDRVHDFDTLDDALLYAEDAGRTLALQGAEHAGAQEIRVQVERYDKTAPVAEGWGDEMYVQTVFEITAAGRPRIAQG
jgi:N-methylhydantoinase A/oxoprolinase/acetone carboxylase beta subunit